MNSAQFQQWCRTRQFSAETVDLIARIRFSPPARRVQGRAGNVCGTYPSRKMGVTIQFESHTVELGAIYLMEHDEVVLEFYDQQPSFKLSYRTASGRKTTHFHTPDFFVIRKDQAGWEEWKTEEQLHKLVEKQPFRYQRRDGQWHCPPGEEYASAFGLSYRVRSSAELPLRNEVAFGVKRLPDDGRSPQERVVRDRGVRASCVVAPLGEVLLTIRRAPSDLQRVSEEQ